MSNKVTLSSVLDGLKNEATSIIKAELTTNPKLSETAAVAAVESGANALLAKAGPLGALAEPVVDAYIAFEVPAVYDEIVKDALGTAAGEGVIAGQS
jgi:hypothetical protein